MEASKQAKVAETLKQMTRSELSAMIEWIDDCGGNGRDMTAREVVACVESTYSGGLTEWFLVQAEEREMREDFLKQFVTRPEVR